MIINYNKSQKFILYYKIIIKYFYLFNEFRSNSCGIRNFDKARGDVMLSDAFKTLNTADLRKNYDSNLKQRKN